MLLDVDQRRRYLTYAAVLGTFICLIGLLRWESGGLLFRQKDFIYEISKGALLPYLGVKIQTTDQRMANIQLETRNFTFSRLCGPNASGVLQGHAHLFLDGRKLKSMYIPFETIGPLKKGVHRIGVSLNIMPDHRVISYQGSPFFVEADIHIDTDN
jgi:hypothetical protein